MKRAELKKKLSIADEDALGLMLVEIAPDLDPDAASIPDDIAQRLLQKQGAFALAANTNPGNPQAIAAAAQSAGVSAELSDYFAEAYLQTGLAEGELYAQIHAAAIDYNYTETLAGLLTERANQLRADQQRFNGATAHDFLSARGCSRDTRTIRERLEALV